MARTKSRRAADGRILFITTLSDCLFPKAAGARHTRPQTGAHGLAGALYMAESRTEPIENVLGTREAKSLPPSSGKIEQIKNNLTMNITEVKNRITKPTPPFFRQLRAIGLVLAGVGGALLAAPVSLPAAIVTAAGYLVTGGAVLSAVSQATVKNE